MAGESARELAKRQREKAERLQRSADLFDRGADGEEATAAALAALPPHEWTVFHDVRWPGRKLANVDHVVVGPAGVFVIDSKNWSGRIEVRDGVLRQNGYQRETTVAAAAEAAIAISLLAAHLEARLAVPVLCFTRDEPIVGWARDVMVCSTANVVQMLTTRPVVLDAAQRQQICLGLDLGLSAAGRARHQSAATRPVGVTRTPRRAPSPRRSPGRGTPKRRRSRPGPLAQLVRLAAAAVAMLVLLTSGLLPALGQRFGELMVDQVAPEQVEPTPAPTENPRKDRPARDRGPSPKQG